MTNRFKLAILTHITHSQLLHGHPLYLTGCRSKDQHAAANASNNCSESFVHEMTMFKRDVTLYSLLITIHLPTHPLSLVKTILYPDRCSCRVFYTFVFCYF